MKLKLAYFEHGLCLKLDEEDALSVSHGGRCDEDVESLARFHYVREQLNTFTNDEMARELKGYGAWDEEELEDREANELRIIWLAGGMIRDEVCEASHD